MKEIKGIARVRFLPGKLEQWKRLTEEAMHIVPTGRVAVTGVNPVTSDASRSAA